MESQSAWCQLPLAGIGYSYATSRINLIYKEFSYEDIESKNR